MREIKFRAWNKTTKVINNDFHLSHLWSLPFEENNSNWVLMQYTGLKDKNGVEIYEGDIVHWTGDSEKDYWDRVDVVEWKEKSTGFYPFIKKIEWRTDVRMVEVIGNIYENPELLKEDK